jgi:hypothetical protein
MRNGRLQSVEAVVERQQGVLAEGDDDGLLIAQVWQRQPNAPVPERDEALGRALDRRLEIRIDPRVTRGRSRPPDRDDGTFADSRSNALFASELALRDVAKSFGQKAPGSGPQLNGGLRQIGPRCA